MTNGGQVPGGGAKKYVQSIAISLLLIILSLRPARPVVYFCKSASAANTPLPSRPS